MKKLLSVIFIVTLLFSVTSYSQNWEFVKNFPDDTSLVNGKSTSTGGHGLAVDPQGKVWVQLYGATESLPGVTQKTRALFVYNPDGTPALFSPIQIVTVGGVTDTLWNSGRGGTTDHMGNPSFTFFDKVYTFNYLDGSGLRAVVPTSGSTGCAPAFDGEGYLYYAHVLPGLPVKIMDVDYNFVANAVDTVVDYGRTLAVTPDGLTLFVPRFGIKQMQVYTRGSKFDAFTFDAAYTALFDGAACESMTWNPVNGYLYFDAGSYFDVPDTNKWTRNAWYGFDTKSKTIKDSIFWKFTVPANPNERPRAIAFSPNGQYVYLSCFGASTYPPVQMHRRIGSYVSKEEGVATNFKLSQNYPNPFNPSTRIEFSILQEGFVTLKVYNSLGQEVATLVNEYMKPGNYSTFFSGYGMPTGTYLYKLSTNGQSLTKKMLLVK